MSWFHIIAAVLVLIYCLFSVTRSGDKKRDWPERNYHMTNSCYWLILLIWLVDGFK